MDLQLILALSIVAATAIVLGLRFIRGFGKKSGCGTCGCPLPEKSKKS